MKTARLAVTSWHYFSESLSGGNIVQFPTRAEVITEEKIMDEFSGSEVNLIDTRPPKGRLPNCSTSHGNVIDYVHRTSWRRY